MKPDSPLKKSSHHETFLKALLLAILWLPLILMAQPARRDSISWSEFVEIYFDSEELADDEDPGSRLDMYETFEELHASPLNINTCSREELMWLPFISPAKADSIIAYRDRRGFLSLGELLFIKTLTYADRLYLPLFVYVGERARRKPSLGEQLAGGKYEVETRLDIPLYTRDGNGTHTRSELERYPNRAYHGNGLHHVLRLRYKYGSTWAYGLTLEKDAGEPFAGEGNWPYDYVSFYLHHRNSNKYEWIAGDYEVRSGMGLLLGNGFFLNKQWQVNSNYRRGLQLKPHTATEENRFFRGMAGRIKKENAEVAVFASWRTLDASFRGDTILTLQTTGYHRTPSEIDRKDFATAFTLGGHAAYFNKRGELGFTAYATHFTKPIYPDLRYYNTNYFRGKTAAGFALDYNWRSDKWDFAGEAAVDQKLHLAYTGQVRFRASDELQFFMQHRHLSPHFISLYGQSLQEGARCSNEHGALIGTAYQTGRLSLTAYADAFFLPRATFLNHKRTRGVEAYINTTFRQNETISWQAFYRYKTKERGISGHAELTEFVQTHRATLRMTLSFPRLTINPALTACLRSPQANENSFGWMTSLRSTWNPSTRWHISAFAALFMSDDYQSALYAYEPQLLRQAGFPSFYYHGMRFVCAVRTELPWGLDAGLRVGSLHYFNREEISSGTQRIRSSWKNDVSLQLRWRIKGKRKSI